MYFVDSRTSHDESRKKMLRILRYQNSIWLWCSEKRWSDWEGSSRCRQGSWVMYTFVGHFKGFKFYITTLGNHWNIVKKRASWYDFKLIILTTLRAKDLMGKVWKRNANNESFLAVKSRNNENFKWTSPPNMQSRQI